MTPEAARRAQERSEKQGSCLLYPTRRNHGPHKEVYEALVGPVRPGMWLDHTCNNGRCINTDHLLQVTPQQNTMLGNTRRRRQMAYRDLRVATALHDHVIGIRPDVSKDRRGRGAR